MKRVVEGRVGVTAAVKGGVERTEAELRLGDHHAPRFDLVVEKGIEAAHVEHRAGRRELPVRDHVDAVRRRVDAMRAVRNRHIAGQLRPLPAVEHRNAVHLLILARGNRCLDPFDVEDDDPVQSVRHRLREGEPFLGIVAGREGVFAWSTSVLSRLPLTMICQATVMVSPSTAENMEV